MRLTGLDTPEMNSQDPAQRELAKAAKAFVMLWNGFDVVIKSTKKDKYGRFLAEVFLKDGSTINSKLLSEGHAVTYSGGPR